MRVVVSKRSLFAFFIAVMSLSSCKKEAVNSSGDGSPGSSGSPKPNVVMGTVYDANGNKFKIPGATVVVHVFGTGNIGESDPAYNIQMDENSHYESKVANGVYQFHGRAYIPLNGNKVCVDLQSLDGK